MHLHRNAVERSVVAPAPPETETGNLRDGTVTGDGENATAVSVPPVVPGYEILQVVGQGSMGIVYKARQRDLHRNVALKMILADANIGQERLQRFNTEARALASLQHSNIVQIYEINVKHSPPYFSMELVEGGTLAERLGGRPQPVRAAAQLVLTLARTIHAVHLNGIVHRDLKPGNILLVPLENRASAFGRLALDMDLHSPDLGLGTPKITDFGLAKEMFAGTSQTESGVIMGTPSYMAPEQAEGKSREVGPAADIYALGAILYEMLTGRAPFTAESAMETLMMLFHAEPVSPSQLQPKIPRDLETICLKCLHKKPGRRYASAEELASDLQRFLAGDPILARPASVYERLGKWMRRRPTLATLAGCSVLVGVSLLGLTFWHQMDLHDQLGQALQDERATRTAEEAANERERLGQLREKLKDLLHAGEAAIAVQDWQQAQINLVRARDQVAGEPDLADWRPQIDQLMQRSNQQRLDYDRLEKFLKQRDEVLFHATLFTGNSLASTLKETRATASEALSLFGMMPDSAVGPNVGSPYYTERQKAEIVTDCYELLVVMADAVATPLPSQSLPEQRSQAEDALAILERARALGVTTQAYHRRRAQYLTQAGKSAEARQEKKRADAMNPSTSLDHFLLGQEQYRQGQCKQAIVAFESALQLQPDHFWARYYLGLSWLKTQRPDQAVTCLTSCLGQRRDFPWAYLLRASAWSELGQFARAEADFDSAQKAHLPDSAGYGLLVNRGVMRIRQGRLDLAKADLKQAIALRPNQYQGYLNLAQAQLKDGKRQDALDQLDHSIRLEPSLGSLYRTRARIHLLRQDQKAALADLDDAIRLEPSTSILILAEDHLTRGRLLFQQKDFVGAVHACGIVFGLRPHDPRAYRLRAEALLELKRPSEALQSLDDCLKHGPVDAGAFRREPRCGPNWANMPAPKLTIPGHWKSNRTLPHMHARGWCYLVADAPKLALTDFEEAIRLAPEHGDAYAGRGASLVLRGDFLLAVKDAEKASACGLLTPHLCYNVAHLLPGDYPARPRTGRVPRAKADLLRVDWQDRAMQALTKALDLQSPDEAGRFWKNVVQPDQALNPLRRFPRFKQLAAR